ncbi:hypothetical protein [Rhodococcoides fascians]|uniref:hypothetical protein n=1 Tax=Rhodococcoides fascians TaxID=1828 RepID=UPI000563857B|nr:hypothetical protein [Rhodococcus fascians]
MHDHNAPEPTQAAAMPAQPVSARRSFFHVDRSHTLAQTGGSIALNGGLSEHGRRYQGGPPLLGFVSWAGMNANVVSNELFIENFFELYRHTTHPGLPSRFHSLFAFDSVGDAQGFAANPNGPYAPIWELAVLPGDVVDGQSLDG